MHHGFCNIQFYTAFYLMLFYFHFFDNTIYGKNYCRKRQATKLTQSKKRKKTTQATDTIKINKTMELNDGVQQLLQMSEKKVVFAIYSSSGK